MTRFLMCKWHECYKKIRLNSIFPAIGIVLLPACAEMSALSVTPLVKTSLVESYRGGGTLLAFSHGKSVIVKTNEQEAQLLEFNTGTVRQSIKSPKWHGTQFIDSDEAGHMVMQATGDLAEIWDMHSGRHIRTFTPTSERGYSPFSWLASTGKYIYFSEQLWDIPTGKSVAHVPHVRVSSDAAMSRDGRYFALTGIYSTRLVNLNTQQMTWLGEQQGVSKVLFGTDNRLYQSYDAHVDSEGTATDGKYLPRSIALIDAGNAKTLASFTAGSAIACWVLLPEQRLFAVLTNQRWLVLDEQLRQIQQWHNTLQITSCVAGRDGTLYIAGYKPKHNGAGYHVFSFDYNRGELIQVLTQDDKIEGLVLSMDGRYIGVNSASARGQRFRIYSTVAN